MAIFMSNISCFNARKYPYYLMLDQVSTFVPAEVLQRKAMVKVYAKQVS